MGKENSRLNSGRNKRDRSRGNMDFADLSDMLGLSKNTLEESASLPSEEKPLPVNPESEQKLPKDSAKDSVPKQAKDPLPKSAKADRKPSVAIPARSESTSDLTLDAPKRADASAKTTTKKVKAKMEKAKSSPVSVVPDKTTPETDLNAQERRAKIYFRLQVCLVISILFHIGLLFYLKDRVIQYVFETPQKFDKEQLMELMDLPRIENRVVPVYNTAQIESPNRIEEFEKVQPMVSADQLEGDHDTDLPQPSELSAKIDHEFQKQDMPDLQDASVLKPTNVQDLEAPAETVTPNLSRTFNMTPATQDVKDSLPTDEIQTSLPENVLEPQKKEMGQLGDQSDLPPSASLVLRADVKDLIQPAAATPSVSETDLSWTNPLRAKAADIPTTVADAPVPLSRPTPTGRPKSMTSPEDASMYIASAARVDLSHARRITTEGNQGVPRPSYDSSLNTTELTAVDVSRTMSRETPRRSVNADLSIPNVPRTDMAIRLRNYQMDNRVVPEDIASVQTPMDSWRRNRPNPTQAYVGRDPNLRVETISRFGGSPITSQAIDRGVQYLSSTQWPDGRWTFHIQPDSLNVPVRAQQNGSIQCDTGATALGLLALMGAGYTHLDGQYAESVHKGLQYLISHQQRIAPVSVDGVKGMTGALYNTDTDTDINSLSYAHAMATVALCEAYGMTQDRRLLGPAQDAVRYIIATQNPTKGGWRYETEGALGIAHKEADTSSSGWQLMALRSALAAEVGNTSGAIERARKWLDLARNPKDGLYTYNPFNGASDKYPNWRSTTPAMTAEGAFMQWAIGSDLADLSSCVEYLRQNPPQTHSSSQIRRDVYYWYYATTVMFAYQGPEWREWQNQIMPMIRNFQTKDETPLSGSWDPSNPVQDRWGHVGGRHYLTCMNLMILEIYARHLPLYQNMGANNAKRDK